jgi:hypothetical protein
LYRIAIAVRKEEIEYEVARVSEGVKAFTVLFSYPIKTVKRFDVLLAVYSAP